MTTMAVATVIVPDMSDGISQMGENHALVAESTYSILIIFCSVTIVTKQHPSKATSGQQVSYCLVSLHLLCDILCSHPVCAENMQPWGE